MVARPEAGEQRASTATQKMSLEHRALVRSVYQRRAGSAPSGRLGHGLVLRAAPVPERPRTATARARGRAPRPRVIIPCRGVLDASTVTASGLRRDSELLQELVA